MEEARQQLLESIRKQLLTNSEPVQVIVSFIGIVAEAAEMSPTLLLALTNQSVAEFQHEG